MQSIKPHRAVALCLSCFVTAMPAAAQEEAETAPAEAVVTEAPADAEAQPLDKEALGMQMPEPASMEDVSFSIGFTIGDDLKRRAEDINTQELIQGIRAGLGDQESRLSHEQISRALFSFQMQMQQKMMAQAKENLAEGQAYLQENAKKQGVTVTESGLQYKVIRSGDGASPTMGDVVAANYRGTFIDGTEFDSSPQGEPAQFAVAEVIQGWTEALLMMKVGDKWELAIPAELGYGEYGPQDGSIGPNETLLFEIELVEIK